MYRFLALFLSIAFAALPLVTSAQGIAEFLTGTVLNIINVILQLLIAIATLVFIWGVIAYIIAGGDESRTEAAKNIILWGVIGLALIVAVWGLVRIIVTGLFADTTPLPPPTFNSGGGGGGVG